MKNITSKQVKIIKALLKLNKSIEDLKKLSSIEYTDFFKVLVLNDKIDLYKDLTTAENLKLLGLSMTDIEKVVELLKDYNEVNLKEKSTADYLINGAEYKGRIALTKNDRKELSEYFGDVCDCCSKSVIFCGVNIGEFHHKKQVSKGGNTSIKNLALLCPNCHTIMHKVFLSNGIEYNKAKEEIKKMM